jgi:hypothetical protein
MNREQRHTAVAYWLARLRWALSAPWHEIEWANTDNRYRN